MLLTRFRGWLMVGFLLAGAALPAHAGEWFAAKNWLPFQAEPGIRDYHNLQPFDHADLSQYGTGPKANEGFFFQYDRTIWAFSGPKKTPVGSVAAAGTLVTTVPQPFGPDQVFAFLNENSVDTGFAQTDWVWGNRYELGYITDESGWLFSSTFVHEHDKIERFANATTAFNDPFLINSQWVDFNGDGVDDDLNNNGIFGNNSPFNVDTSIPPDGTLDAYVGPDFGDLVSLPITFNNLFVQNQTSFSSLELMHITRWDPLHAGGTVEWLLGLRYSNVSDNFRVIGTGGQGILTNMLIDARTRNNLVGPQVGIRWNKQTGHWRIGSEARFMAAANFQQAWVDSSFNGNGGQIQAGTIVGGNDSTSDTTWAPLGELRLDVGYQVSKAITLRMGYTGLVAGGITRASRRVNYQLPQALILDGNKSEAFIVNGFNFGIEINR